MQNKIIDFRSFLPQANKVTPKGISQSLGTTFPPAQVQGLVQASYFVLSFGNSEMLVFRRKPFVSLSVQARVGICSTYFMALQNNENF